MDFAIEKDEIATRVQAGTITKTADVLGVASGVVTLSASGVATVLNPNIPANARVLLTAQPGPAQTGHLQCTAIVANTSFTITSSTGAGDTGVHVYYSLSASL